MSFATHLPSPPSQPSQPPASPRRSHSSTSTSMSSSRSSLSSASSAAPSSPLSRPSSTMPVPSSSKSNSKVPSALHHQPQPARRTAGTTSPLLMFVHPHAPIHTPIPPSLRHRQSSASAPNSSPPFTPPLPTEEMWFDNAEFRTPAGTPASAPCSPRSSPLLDTRPLLPLRKSADSATFPLHSKRY